MTLKLFNFIPVCFYSWSTFLPECLPDGNKHNLKPIAESDRGKHCLFYSRLILTACIQNLKSTRALLLCLLLEGLMKHIETDILKPVALNLILQCQFVSFFFLFLYFFFSKSHSNSFLPFCFKLQSTNNEGYFQIIKHFYSLSCYNRWAAK